MTAETTAHGQTSTRRPAYDAVYDSQKDFSGSGESRQRPKPKIGARKIVARSSAAAPHSTARIGDPAPMG